MCKRSDAALLADLAKHLRLSEVVARRLVRDLPDRGLASKIRSVRRLIAHSRHETQIVALLLECGKDLPVGASPELVDHYTCARCCRMIPVGKRCACGAGHVGAGMAREDQVAPALPPEAEPEAGHKPIRCRPWLWALMAAAGALGAMWSLALWALESGLLLPPAVPL